MTSLSIIPAGDLTIGDRFQFMTVQHVVEGFTLHPKVGLMDVETEDREAPVTLFPSTPVVLLAAGVAR